MEVLSNGMKVKFWIPVEEEPDVDRFVDEQIMIDMDAFMLVGILVSVGTCKKKNEEKEYEYFKQLTVDVINICSAADNNINIQIPGSKKKDEFLYDVKFRYAPEPIQEEEPELTNENDLELAYKDQHGNDIDRETELPVEQTEAKPEANMDMTPGTMYDGAKTDLTAPDAADFGEEADAETETPVLIVKDERTGEDTDVTDMVTNILKEGAAEEAEKAFEETVCEEAERLTETETDDDDGIDWGE